MPTPHPAFGTFRLRARPPSSQNGDPSTTKWAKISGTQGPIASLRRSTSDRTHTARAPRRSPHITATDRFVALGNRSFLGRTIVAESRFRNDAARVCRAVAGPNPIAEIRGSPCPSSPGSNGTSSSALIVTALSSEYHYSPLLFDLHCRRKATRLHSRHLSASPVRRCCGRRCSIRTNSLTRVPAKRSRQQPNCATKPAGPLSPLTRTAPSPTAQSMVASALPIVPEL